MNISTLLLMGFALFSHTNAGAAEPSRMVCVYDNLSVRGSDSASGSVLFEARPFDIVEPVAATKSLAAAAPAMTQVRFPTLAGQPTGWVDSEYLAPPELCPGAPDATSSVPAQFSGVDPKKLVPRDLLAGALNYFAANQANIANKTYLAVVNLGAYSGAARFFVINVSTGAVSAIHVAHGKGSDRGFTGYAHVFSNTPDSDMSSLGVYRTGEEYDGKHGHSLRLIGLSPTNSQVEAREIVLHEASYVHEDGSAAGRSDGCFALASTTIAQVLKELGAGAIIYAGVASGSKYPAPAPN